jgi:hypothetical protein
MSFSLFGHRKKSPGELVKSTKKHIELLQQPHTQADEKLLKKVRQIPHTPPDIGRHNGTAEIHSGTSSVRSQASTCAAHDRSLIFLLSVAPCARGFAALLCARALCPAVSSALRWWRCLLLLAVARSRCCCCYCCCLHCFCLVLLRSFPVPSVPLPLLALVQSMEKITLNLSSMKFMLYGDAENEPKEADQNKLVEEVSMRRK